LGSGDWAGDAELRQDVGALDVVALMIVEVWILWCERIPSFFSLPPAVSSEVRGGLVVRFVSFPERAMWKTSQVQGSLWLGTSLGIH
jgi:hypothetical protein